ncbi:hypothetical protein [Caldalkalibacillus salinus]|uniref:hypothetical protein n=1 Tax=Caldalkalibacillus salinus TaxID=2803787 RepID=UPI001921EC4E|nr:hypothetical protein [Caldalkalibacillus salinus]
MHWKEEQRQVSPLDQPEYWLDFRSTHLWFGPHSPVYKDEKRECEYLHIFFPTN